MTDPVAAEPERPSPAAAFRQAFEAVQRGPMRDVPIVNAVLSVETVGFRPWGDHWLGILVTPWCMNLVLAPRIASKWQPVAERESRFHVFPAGVFEFIGARHPALGDFQACSLFSPMFEFDDPGQARATAEAALAALFDVASRAESTVPSTPAAAATPPLLSKRDLLFGRHARGDRAP
jgi:[NiFe] hydrogenase assembly HybE family chaperone